MGVQVIVVGAGIAGLSTALALLERGVEVTVVEQAAALGEVGAGIQISSNGVAVLRELGLEEALARVSVRPERWEYLDLDTGELLFESPLGQGAEALYGYQFYHAHRADLLDVLAGAVPSEVIRLNARCVHVDQDSSGVTVKLASGEALRAHALVAADGIHSLVREQLLGPEKARFTGLLGWRALIPEERLRPLGLPHCTYIWSGSGRCLVGYWVRGGSLFNFLGLVPGAEVHRESWSTMSNVEDLRLAVADTEPRIRHIVDAIEAPFITGLFDRNPLDCWTQGRVALLGDAAHAMVPHLAQGACQALEDSWMLATCLVRHGVEGVADGLLEYEQRRRPRTTKIQVMAREAAKLLHETDPDEVRARNGRWKGVARIDPLRETVFGWLYSYNAVKEAEAPIDRILGLAPAFEGKQMRRPASQRAFEMWKGIFTPADVAGGFDGMRTAYDRFFLDNFAGPSHVEVTPDGLWVQGPGKCGDVVLLHLHGGGFVMGSARASVELAGRLAGAVEGRCLVLDYRLAPEHPFPAALDDALTAYRRLLDQGVSAGNILVSGDSAGGGLALSTILALQHAGDPLPAGVIIMSPITDLTVSGPTIREFGGQDPLMDRDRLVLFASSYFQAHDPTDPLVSPLFGEFRGFPPLLVQAARGEVLMSDTTRLAERATAAGAEVTLSLYDDTVHAFPIFPFLPETGKALERIRSFAHRHVAQG